ncbi:hypothetical protein EJB05_15947, partial [Eragrostis curvula]
MSASRTRAVSNQNIMRGIDISMDAVEQWASASAATIYTARQQARETELVTAEPGELKLQAPEKLAIFHTAASEGATATTTMSLGSKSFPARQAGGGGGGEGGDGRDDDGRKQPRYGRCFSGLELRIGPGPLRDMDPGRLKGQIRKWAKAVVAYARQISFGSPRSRPTSSPTSAALPAAKSSLGREEPPAPT